MFICVNVLTISLSIENVNLINSETFRVLKINNF